MNKELFLQRLEQLAELKRSKITRQPGCAHDPDSACDIFRNGETFIIDKDNNKTWHYEIARLKPIIKPCEDCGRLCEDRTTTKSLLTFPKRHWRTYCGGCQRVFNPETQQYDLTLSKAQAFFVTYLKQRDK